MYNDIELKPCPFCGGKAVMFQIGGVSTSLWSDVLAEYIVMCTVCNIQTQKIMADFLAAEKWNRRINESEDSK